MRRDMKVYAPVLLFLPLIPAHRGVLTRPSCDDDFGSSTTALPIPDASISWAFQHYFDCTNRALWMSFDNPSSNFSFYVGVGIPTLDRFAYIRADALIVGPGLPALETEVLEGLPDEVKNDPILTTPGFGAYFHQGPQDQSTCDHLGTVMAQESTVFNGRCDFFEPFSQTHSWRLLDADNNLIPNANDIYYVAVWPREAVSTKLTVAMGTWVEDFTTSYNLVTPTCQRNMDDYFEKKDSQEACFPVLECANLSVA